MDTVPTEQKTVNCKLCGTQTTGSTGAAGIFWPMLCQPCKDAADKDLLNQVKATALSMKYIDKMFDTLIRPCTKHNEPMRKLVTHGEPECPVCREEACISPCTICSTLDDLDVKGHCRSCEEATRDEFSGLDGEDKHDTSDCHTYDPAEPLPEEKENEYE